MCIGGLKKKVRGYKYTRTQGGEVIGTEAASQEANWSCLRGGPPTGA